MGRGCRSPRCSKSPQTPKLSLWRSCSYSRRSRPKSATAGGGAPIEPVVCGDGIVAGDEECDGSAFDVSCIGGGTPTVCTAGCTADLSTCPPPPDGFVCDNPVDLSSVTFPHTQTGQFDDDPPGFFTCSGPVSNVIWYEYVAPATADYEIEAINASTTGPFSHLVVLEGNTCSPFGPVAYSNTVRSGTRSAM